MKLGPRRNYHEGRAAIRHYANQTAWPLWLLRRRRAFSVIVLYRWIVYTALPGTERDIAQKLELRWRKMCGATAKCLKVHAWWAFEFATFPPVQLLWKVSTLWDWGQHLYWRWPTDQCSNAMWKVKYFEFWYVKTTVTVTNITQNVFSDPFCS